MTSQSQTKWKFRAVLAAVLAVGVVALCLFIGKIRERQAFVSKVVAGYRYRCTLSDDWKRKPTTSGVSPDTVESYTFSASPSPIREWIATHLFHQSSTKGPSFIPDGRPELHLATETGKVQKNIKIVAGYPELDLGRQPVPGLKIIPGKHFRVDNCPGTMARLDLTALQINNRYNFLLVCTPDYANTYAIAIVAEARDSDQEEREMQAILASFHIEKVVK